LAALIDISLLRLQPELYTSSKRLAALPISSLPPGKRTVTLFTSGAFNNLADLTLQVHLAFPKWRSGNEPHPIAYFEAGVRPVAVLHFPFA
jgi:hypothetical protein